MTTNITDAGQVGHLDRRETLLSLLSNYTKPDAVECDPATYNGWTKAKRETFNDARMARIVHSIVVPIPPFEALLKQVRLASWFAERPVGRTGVFLTGPATMGKTTAAFHAMVEAHRRHENRFPNWRQLGHTPVVYVEVGPASTPKGFMGRLLDFFGVPYFNRTTLEERTLMVIHQLQHGHTSLIVIDEMQNLARLRQGDFESAQAIKNLMNGVRAVPLYVGIDLDESALTNGALGAQFAGRSSLIKLGALGFSTKAEQDSWRGVIYSFERQLGLLNHPPKTLFPLAKQLWTMTNGSIGALSRLLTTTALELILDDNADAETITPDHLTHIKLDIATERMLDAGQPYDRKGKRDAA